MPAAIAIASILAITAFAYAVRRFLRIAVCPICVGVAGTWILILTGIGFGLLGADGWKLVAAIAMGGSVVGIAYQIEQRLPPGRDPLLWKTLFIPIGFAAAYALLAAAYAPLAASAGVAALIAFLFRRKPRRLPSGQSSAAEKRVADLEKRMKQCC